MKLTIENEQQLKEIAEFMEACGISEVTKEGLVSIAINEFYQSFLRLGTFNEFLNEQKSYNFS